MDELMEILEELRPDVDFEKETALIDDGVLDSFDIVALVGELNEAFDIEIKPNNLPKETEEKLRCFLQYCKDNKFENVVFAKFPHRITKKKFYERFQMGNTMAEIIREYGFDYLDFENNCKDVGLDHKEDFYNDDHMNIYGQQKFTKYLGKILVDKYGVKKSELSENNKARWDSSAEYIKLYYKYFEKCHKEGKNAQLYETFSLMCELDNLKKQKNV